MHDDLAAELDSLHVQGILEAREWRSTGLVYIFIVDYFTSLNSMLRIILNSFSLLELQNVF
jgi:hypothetical protein